MRGDGTVLVVVFVLGVGRARTALGAGWVPYAIRRVTVAFGVVEAGTAPCVNTQEPLAGVKFVWRFALDKNGAISVPIVIDGYTLALPAVAEFVPATIRRLIAIVRWIWLQTGGRKLGLRGRNCEITCAVNAVDDRLECTAPSRELWRRITTRSNVLTGRTNTARLTFLVGHT